MLHNLLRQPYHTNDVDIKGMLQALARQLCEIFHRFSLHKREGAREILQCQVGLIRCNLLLQRYLQSQYAVSG